MKKLFVSSVFFSLFFLFFVGCSVRPLIVNWPNVVVETNLPLSSQGVVVTAPPGLFLDVKKTGRYGQTILVKNLPPGENFFIPADGFWSNQTIVITIRGYDAKGNLMGVRSRQFWFYNSGYDSRVEYWDVSVNDLQRH